MSTRRSNRHQIHGFSRRRFVQASAGTVATFIATNPRGSFAQSATPAASPSGPFDPLVLVDDKVDGTYPLTDEKVTLKVLIPSNADVGSFEDNDFTRWYEERTNVHIEWSVIPAEEANTALNLRLTSGDYPDIIMSFNLKPAVQQLYGEMGTFQPLNEYVDTQAVEFQRVLDQYPLSRNVITAADGNIYSLPYVNDCYHCAQDRKMWIYRPWLDALGLEMPTTTDAYREVLKAFKEQDPNGNGKNDELPLTSCATNGWNTDLDMYFMNAFVYNPGEPWLSAQDGKISAVYATDGWKEGIRYLQSLFADGLIDPEAFTQDNSQLVAKGDNPDAPIIGSAPGGSWGVFVSWKPNDPSGRWAGYELMPPLAGPDGTAWSPFDPYLPYASGNFIVTDKCKDPGLAFRWADGLYDFETTMRSVEGVLDEQWRWATEGEKGMDGEQAIWAKIDQEDDSPGPKNHAWVQTGPSFRSGRARLGELDANPDLRKYNLDIITKDTLRDHAQPAEWALPPLFVTPDQAQAIAETEATIVPYVKEYFAQVITGQMDLDSSWEDYLGQLSAMGLENYLQIQQDAFDTTKNNQ